MSYGSDTDNGAAEGVGGGWGAATPGWGNDATAYGGRNAGFDQSYGKGDTGLGYNSDGSPVNQDPTAWGPPQEAPPAPDVWNPPEDTLTKPAPISYENLVPSFLRDMFKNGNLNPNQQSLDRSLNNLIQSPVAPQQERGLLDRLGLRGFGVTSDQLFDSETPAMRDDRMGLVGKGLGTIGNSFISASPMGPAMSAVRAYDSYVNDPSKNVTDAVAKGASGMGGYIGALGNLYNGDYGKALTGVLSKNGVSSPTSNLAGIGLNYAQGKNVAPSLAGLAGQFAGRSVGGNVGATLGKTLGQQFGGSYSIRK